ncbi:TPA: DNA-directed RNA polymerase subunit B'', partial [Candidatus Bathyarchaeota archaeon]|nr:DNA-directed RNA polymerase subunit B'' [Candidatus Bathyarchaeota archaeon]
MLMSLSSSDRWQIMKAFFDERGLASLHIDSYNKFIKRGLQKVIRAVGDIEVDVPGRPFTVKFGRVEIGKPRVLEIFGSSHIIYPREARLRSITYSSPLYLEMTVVRDGKEEETRRIHIGDLPVMVKSCICLLTGLSRDDLIDKSEDPDDVGGYFIVNGSERVMPAVENLAPNRILVDIDTRTSKPSYVAKVFSTTVNFRARIEVRMESDRTISVWIPGVPTKIPLVVLMRALGLKSDRKIAEAISLRKEIQDELIPSFEDAADIKSADDAILYIGNRIAYGQVESYRRGRAEQVLDRNLLPHVGMASTDRYNKALFLGEMVSRIIELKRGERTPDDKDHLANKRLALAGDLLSDLFKVAFTLLKYDMKYQLKRMSMRKGRVFLDAAVRHGLVSERIQHALATGNWGKGRVAITQLLDRVNMLSALSHLRRIQSPLMRGQPNFEARDLHPTQWGRLCPNETPEGSNCGLVTNLALMASVSRGTDEAKVKRCLYRMGVVPLRKAPRDVRERGTKIFFNGVPIGYHVKPVELTRSIRRLRREGKISPEVNIALYDREVHVNCDAGRIRRPLIVVEGGRARLTEKHVNLIRSGKWKWADLINHGVIEYLDADEEENALVALSRERITEEHTHLEIAPYTILGITASTIPYAEYNQSPKNSHEAAMAKQALGIPVMNYFYRSDSRFHILHYPQSPLVRTKPLEILNYDAYPIGQNFTVAVLSYGGYNMEDAVVINKASIERGLARSTFFRTYEGESKRYPGGLKDKFTIPEAGVRGYRGEYYYRLLESDGVVGLEMDVTGGDVLIGRVSPPRFVEEYKLGVKSTLNKDTSIALRPNESGITTSVIVVPTIEGSKLVKMVVRTPRIPELGDKFASRHGQKGVVGAIIPEEDLPFTEDGIVPDLIINPHAIPSRMTIGQFIEFIAGKVAALRGTRVDGTPFDGEKVDDLREQLVAVGPDVVDPDGCSGAGNDQQSEQSPEGSLPFAT